MNKNTKNFIQENNIKIESEWVENNPHMENSQNMNNYKVTLRFNKRQLTTYFSMGMALTGEPTAHEVVDCLAMDSYTYINEEDFKEFCSNFGYNEDSRKDYKLYNSIISQSKKLEKFLGKELFLSLVNDYERL